MMTYLWRTDSKHGRLISIVPTLPGVTVLIFNDIEHSDEYDYVPVLAFAHIEDNYNNVRFCPIILLDEMAGEMTVVNAPGKNHYSFAGIFFSNERLDDKDIKLRLEIIREMIEEDRKDEELGRG